MDLRESYAQQTCIYLFLIWSDLAFCVGRNILQGFSLEVAGSTHWGVRFSLLDDLGSEHPVCLGDPVVYSSQWQCHSWEQLPLLGAQQNLAKTGWTNMAHRKLLQQTTWHQESFLGPLPPPSFKCPSE